MRKLDKTEILEFINSKNRTDLNIFLSKFNNKIYRVDTINSKTGEGTYDLYESDILDSFDLAFELGIKPIYVHRLRP